VYENLRTHLPDDLIRTMETLVRCPGCHEKLRPGETLRRARCPRCYDAWVKARPIGVGAQCAGCDNRRRAQLRHFEVGGPGNAVGARWVILCHNCVATAETLKPPPRSVEGLKMRLARDRRWGDRRAASVGGLSTPPPEGERRRGSRRRSDAREIVDASELVLDEDEVQVIELEADFELLDGDLEAKLVDIEDVTGIHTRV
jgi:hypothetical protein